MGEWTRDRHSPRAYEFDLANGAGERSFGELEQTNEDRTIRGPGWFRASVGMRVSARHTADETSYKSQVFGVRRSRAIDG